ncbi:MAG: hypothetical protein VX529_11040 [Pseudomonadota bacterium]|nr:hypothetical protein [Pseudomonadota bacterium]
MTRDQFICFMRNFRRPYASIMCATALAGSVWVGGFTGHFLPAALGWVLAAVIGLDVSARMVEKIQGAASA